MVFSRKMDITRPLIVDTDKNFTRDFACEISFTSTVVG